jgi:hypothetical protein
MGWCAALPWPRPTAPRALLQNLMLAYGVEVAERGGKLICCQMRAGRADATADARQSGARQ